MAEALTISKEQRDQLESWARELRQNAAEIARLNAEREAVLAKIHAARLLFGEDVVPQVEPPPSGAPARTSPANQPAFTFISFIEEALEKAESGLTLPELSAALKDSPLRERFINNPNAVYTAVGRLVERDRAIREGRMVYSPRAYARVKAGDVPERDSRDAEQSVRHMVLSVLRGSDKALTSGEILDEIKQDPGAAARLAVRPQIGYNAIGRLARKGEIIKDGRLYRLPPTPPSAP